MGHGLKEESLYEKKGGAKELVGRKWKWKRERGKIVENGSSCSFVGKFGKED